jgi:hypothetical protein
VVDVTVIAMWAHPRSVSTAFLRMMIERGDVTVVHEPLVTLWDAGEVEVPSMTGEPFALRSTGEVLAQFALLGKDRPVFFKDTLEYRFQYLFDHPDEIADFTHTFIVRDPAKTIASHHAAKPNASCSDIGYEHQHQLFELTWRITGRRPVVITAESLLADPAATVEKYCAAVGIPFLPDALTWEPAERAEWQRARHWHVDVIKSSGFRAPDKKYAVTVDNDERLRAYYDHHRPFYDRLVEHAI